MYIHYVITTVSLPIFLSLSQLSCVKSFYFCAAKHDLLTELRSTYFRNANANSTKITTLRRPACVRTLRQDCSDVVIHLWRKGGWWDVHTKGSDQECGNVFKSNMMCLFLRGYKSLINCKLKLLIIVNAIKHSEVPIRKWVHHSVSHRFNCMTYRIFLSACQ